MIAHDAEDCECCEEAREMKKALRALVAVVSSQLTRGEETTPGEFEAAWKQACALAGDGE